MGFEAGAGAGGGLPAERAPSDGRALLGGALLGGALPGGALLGGAPLGGRALPETGPGPANALVTLRLASDSMITRAKGLRTLTSAISRRSGACR